MKLIGICMQMNAIGLFGHLIVEMHR